MNRRAQAFTLVELMVVVAILGVLISLLLPSVQRALSLANEAQCNANLSVIGKALQAYYQANNDRIPTNDADTWPVPKDDPASDDDETLNYLPGTNSTGRWWCNKVYPYGHRNPTLYQCESDPVHFNAGNNVACSYGLNETLTDPNSQGGDDIKTSLAIDNPTMTIIIGHCSRGVLKPGQGIRPAISERLVDEASKWPFGHVPAYDLTAKQRLGRAGFLMASGDVKVLTFTQASLKDDEGGLRLFHGN